MNALEMKGLPKFTRRWVLGDLPAILLVVSILAIAANPVTAQIDPEVRDRVVPAIVQVAVIVEVIDDVSTESIYVPVGSGTIISADGDILTNEHVIDMDEHQKQVQLWNAQADAENELMTFSLDAGRILILTSDGAHRPEPSFLATVKSEDTALDLAILSIVSDEAGALLPEAQTFSFVPLGDSALLRQGDSIDLFGYPAIGGDSLTYTNGVVSGFNFSDDSEDPIWITTNATMSGGSSGGAALDSAGRLIGIPTQGAELDCRPGDTNLDGIFDATDVGCIPVGGSIGQLRPVNLARDLLAQSEISLEVTDSPLEKPEGLDAKETASASQPPTGLDPSQIPLLHLVDDLSGQGSCSGNARYEVGDRVTLERGTILLTAVGDIVRSVPKKTKVEITGPARENNWENCVHWPITVVESGVYFGGSFALEEAVGSEGLVSEIAFLPLDEEEINDLLIPSNLPHQTIVSRVNNHGEDGSNGHSLADYSPPDISFKTNPEEFADECARSPLYRVGDLVNLNHEAALLNSEKEWSWTEWVDAGDTIVIAGPLVESGICDHWPVVLVSHADPYAEAGRNATPLGSAGYMSEIAFLP